jgi:hypothetical protein
MTNKSIATALTFGFLAFTLSVLPVTTAEAGCYIQRTLTGAKPPRCEGSQSWVTTPFGVTQYTCCPKAPTATPGEVAKAVGEAQKEAVGRGTTTTPPSCAPGTTYSENEKRCVKPIKVIGKSKTGATQKSGGPALRAACIHSGWRYDEQAGRCIKPSQAKADCESKGSNYHYDLDSGGCVKTISKAKSQGSTEQAEDLQSQEKTSDDLQSQNEAQTNPSDDLQAKKKKKKRHHD